MKKLTILTSVFFCVLLAMPVAWVEAGGGGGGRGGGGGGGGGGLFGGLFGGGGGLFGGGGGGGGRCNNDCGTTMNGAIRNAQQRFPGADGFNLRQRPDGYWQASPTYDGNGGGRGGGGGGGGAPACTGNPNLIVSDVFFVPATGPATAAAAVTPQAGQQYRPIAVVTNNRCRATSAAGQFVSEGLIGSNGSFPVRLRLDFGRNNNYDYTEYLGNQGPLAGNRATTVVFPAVTISAAGSHSMEGRVDAPVSEAPGQGCSPATGCITESSETDNTRTETFTVTGNNNLPLDVDVNDITVIVGSALNRVPFNVENDSDQTINRVYYSIEINNLVVGDSSQAVVMAPDQEQNINGMVSYTAPSTPTTLPLRVCAQADPSSNPNCDTAQLRVITTQCADRADNDTDTFVDRRDVGCLTDPLDPNSYNPNDNNENDIATSTAMIRIEFGPASPLVRYNEGTNLEYTIQAPRALTCTVSGGGMNQVISYPGGAPVTNFVPSGNLQNTQSFTMKCDASIQGYTISNERSTSVEVIPQAQEV